MKLAQKQRSMGPLLDTNESLVVRQLTKISQLNGMFDNRPPIYARYIY